jgi:hypothetical protein
MPKRKTTISVPKEKIDDFERLVPKLHLGTKPLSQAQLGNEENVGSVRHADCGSHGPPYETLIGKGGGQ